MHFLRSLLFRQLQNVSNHGPASHLVSVSGLTRLGLSHTRPRASSSQSQQDVENAALLFADKRPKFASAPE